MSRRISLTGQIVIGFLGSLLAAALITGLRLALEEGGVKKADIFILFLGSLLVVALVFASLYYLAARAYRAYVLPRLREEARQQIASEVRSDLERTIEQEMEAKTGIVCIFPNFSTCEREIFGELQSSTENRVFIQLGRSIVSGGRDFFNRLDRAVKPGGTVKVLHASSQSPYLSERVASTRGSSYALWQADLRHAEKRLDALEQEADSRTEGREHREGYVWRFFLTANLAYVQPYLYAQKNSERAPVLKISRTMTTSGEENAASLYTPFSAYFDQKWDENVPRQFSLGHLIHPPAKVVATALVRYNQFLIFCIPKRYIAKAASEIPFHGVGGKVEANEDRFEALKREAVEEIGVGLRIGSSARTRYLTTGADLGIIELEDSPKPYCLYKRTREADPNFSHLEVLWLIAYEAVPQIKRLDDIHPGKEIAAALVVTGEILLRSLHEKMTFADIDSAGDGSRVLVADGMEFDFSKRAVPSGLATIVASEERPRLAGRL